MGSGLKKNLSLFHSNVFLSCRCLFQEFTWDLYVWVLYIFVIHFLLVIGQDPTLKTTLSKIGDEIITVNELLNQFELEIQYQEQTNGSLKVTLS